ncbi:MAG: alpha-D-ribose 1-methylphosphonate 5-triphosphate diphosphatase [Armatimonadaceae bacterium]
MRETVFHDCLLVREDRVEPGTLVVRDGVIAEIEPSPLQTGASAQQTHPVYLLPGLVELHTDFLESCLSPRPGVRWDCGAAIAWYDRSLIAAGITTVCAAIAIREVPGKPVDSTEIASLLQRFRQPLTANHRVNLRCELATPTASEVLEELLQGAGVGMVSVVSVMDHTPGQRQFQQIEKFDTYYRRRYNLSETALAEYRDSLLHADREQMAWNRERIAALAHAHGVCLSTHDDTTLAHIAEATKDGARIAEFPTTLTAARAAKEAGIKILMSAPNVVLGGSHSGNLSARCAVNAGVVDILSSDYAPHSLLHAAFLLHGEEGIGLPDAIRMVTLHPAAAIGMEGDRGSLAIGKRADLLTVEVQDHLPRITGVYIAGNRVG